MPHYRSSPLKEVYYSSSFLCSTNFVLAQSVLRPQNIPKRPLRLQATSEVLIFMIIYYTKINWFYPRYSSVSTCLEPQSRRPKCWLARGKSQQPASDLYACLQPISLWQLSATTKRLQNTHFPRATVSSLTHLLGAFSNYLCLLLLLDVALSSDCGDYSVMLDKKKCLKSYTRTPNSNKPPALFTCSSREH